MVYNGYVIDRTHSKEALANIVKKEIDRVINHSSHPTIHNDTDAVWVFSGPGTFFLPLENDEPDFMAWMDHDRILHGISLLKKITASRLQKKSNEITEEDIKMHGPLFIYNGTLEENTALRKAIETEKILPKENVILRDVVFDGKKRRPIENTLDQIKSFPKELMEEKITKRIGIVSHAAHLSRILRYVEFYRLFPNTLSVEIFSVKEPAESTLRDTKIEIDKIWHYFQKGNLSWEPFPSEV